MTLIIAHHLIPNEFLILGAEDNFDMKGNFDVPKKCLVLILVKQRQNFA